MHPLVRLQQKQRAVLADESGVGEQIAAAVVDAAMPALQARVPELATSFVNAAVPQVQARLVDLEPQLRELAVSSAQAVLSDDQIQETIRLAVQDQAQKAEAKLKRGFMFTVAAVLAGTLLIEIAEPLLPGRKRLGFWCSAHFGNSGSAPEGQWWSSGALFYAG